MFALSKLFQNSGNNSGSSLSSSRSQIHHFSPRHSVTFEESILKCIMSRTWHPRLWPFLQPELTPLAPISLAVDPGTFWTSSWQPSLPLYYIFMAMPLQLQKSCSGRIPGALTMAFCKAVALATKEPRQHASRRDPTPSPLSPTLFPFPMGRAPCGGLPPKST